MANSEQTYGTIAGAVIGYVASGFNPYGAVYGAYWGYTISAMLYPGEENREFPGLQDKRVNAGDYGHQIPFGYGIGRTPGWLMEGSEIYEVEINKTTGGGLGSKKVTLTYYDAYFNGAFLICEGPIAGITRMWADGKLLFDYRTGAAAVNFNHNFPRGGGGGGGFRYVYNGPGIRYKFRFYQGSEDQLPDPLLESIHGVGNVPAYRGIAYVVLDGFLLNDFGKRIPNFTFEVAFQGALENSYQNISLARSVNTPGSYHNVTSTPIYYNRKRNTVIISRAVITGGPWVGYILKCIDVSTKAVVWSRDHYSWPIGAQSPIAFNEGQDIIWVGGYSTISAISMTTGDLIKETQVRFGSSEAYSMIHVQSRGGIWIADDFFIRMFSEFRLRVGVWTLGELGSKTYALPYRTRAMYNVPHRRWIIIHFNYSGPYDTIRIISDLGFFVKDVVFPPPAASNSLGKFIISQFYDCAFVYSSGKVLKLSFADFSITEVYIPPSGFGWNVATIFVSDYDGTILTSEHRNPDSSYKKFKLLDGNFDLIQDYELPSNFRFSEMVKVDSTDEVWAITYLDFVDAYVLNLGKIQGSVVSCSTIVADLMNRVGVPSGDYDVSGLSASIEGYVIDRRLPARNSIDPLRIAGLFDIVIENGKIQAKVRGLATVMTVDYNDLVLQEGGKRPYDITHHDSSDTGAIIDLVYNDKDRNYERSVQRDSRLTVRSKEISTVVLPLAISATRARQVAQALLYSAWVGKDVWKIHGSRKHLRLSPGDAFDFVDEFGISRRMVCTAKKVTGFNVVDFDAVLDDETVWTSSIVGSSGENIPTPLAITYPGIIFLDIPILKEQDDYPGLYISTTFGYSNISLYSSEDDGVTFEFFGFLSAAISGFGAGYSADFTSFSKGNVFDDASYLDVYITGGELVSVTDAQMLSGKNICSFGQELLQYGSASLLSSSGGINKYRLTHLLRGRKGTEFAIGSHLSGDQFVLLDPAPERFALSGNDFNVIYKIVINSEDLESNTNLNGFVCTQVGHRPYSPVYITGTRNVSNDLTIGFTRRSRYGSEWGTSVSLPLDQDKEEYEIDIMQGATVKRTIKVTTTTAQYPATDQVTDFGSAQSSVLVNIYQMSSVYGRGTPGIATI